VRGTSCAGRAPGRRGLGTTRHRQASCLVPAAAWVILPIHALVSRFTMDELPLSTLAVLKRVLDRQDEDCSNESHEHTLDGESGYV